MTSPFQQISTGYWLGQPVGQSAPILYSAAAGAIIPTTNPQYLAWLEQWPGLAPWPWPKDATGAITTAALDAILTSYGLPPTGLTPPTAVQLIAYANNKIETLFAVSRVYPLAAGVSVKSDATTGTGTDLISLMTWGNANPGATTSWVDDFGAVTAITGAQAVVLADAVLAYGQSVYAVLASACLEIAGGSITTTAQIDALAWPA